MALYDNNSLLAVLGGQNLNNQTPYAQLQSYQKHGQDLLDAGMPQTMYSPWQAVAYALQKFEGRNEIDSAARVNQDTLNAINDKKQSMVDAYRGYNPPLPNLGGGGQPTGSIDPSSVQGNIAPDRYDNTLIQIESGGNPNARSPGKGTYKGLGQFGPDEEAKYGINDSNRTDPATQINAIHQERKDINNYFQNTLNRQPTDGEAYLAHQQGMAGATALLSNPDVPAYQVLSKFYSPEKALQHIVSNIPSSSPLAHQDPRTITAGQFAHMWTSRFDEAQDRKFPQAAQDQLQQPTQVAENTAPVTTGSNPTASDFHSGLESVTNQYGLEKLLSGLSHGTPPAEPPLSANEANAISHLSPDQQKMYLEQRKQSFTPQTFDTGYGTFWKLPGRAGQPEQVGFIPKYQTKDMSIHGVGSLPVSIGMGADGKPQSSFLIPPGNNGTGSDQEGIPGQQGNNGGGSNPTIANPTTQNREASGPLPNQILEMQNQAAANQRNNQIKTQRDENRAKELDAKYTALQNSFAGNNRLLNSLALQRRIIEDPKFYSGTGASQVLDVGKALNALGKNYGGSADASLLMQEFSKFRAEQNLNSVKALQGLGAIRNTEIEIINASNGDLSNSKEALRAVNEVNTRIAQREQNAVQLASDYAKKHGGYLDNGWYDFANDYYNKHPLFTKDEMKHYTDLFAKGPKRDTTGDGKENETSNYKIGLTTRRNKRTGEVQTWDGNKFVVTTPGNQ